MPVGEALLGRVVDPLGNPLDGQGADRDDRAPPARVQGAGRRRAPAGQGAAPDRDQGDRLDDERRPRPARADHRRPRDRQDRDRRSTRSSTSAATDVICIYVAIGQKGSTVAQVYERLTRRGRDGVHDHRLRARARGRADQVDGAVRRRRDGRVLPLQRQARARHLRRPLEARRRVPAALAAAAPPAGPRGLPRRRLLPALAAARARVQAQRRARRRLADGAADHRDAGRRHRRLHPDERDLDHRRADLPRVRPLLLRRAAGDQRRHVGVARRRAPRRRRR